MATLNSIVSQLADSLNRPNDQILKARLKDLVIQEFGLYVSRSIAKYGIDKEWVLSYYITQLEAVTTINNKTLERPYYRTVNKISRPLRYMSDSPFVYVGLEDGDVPFLYSNLTSRRFSSLLPNIGLVPKYDFVEDRLVFWDLPVTETEPDVFVPIGSLIARFVPADPRVTTTPDIVSTFTLNADNELPVTLDFIQQIKLSLLKGELSVTDSKDKVEASHIDNE